MKKPALPNNEETRLKTLHSLNILDTEKEERFDRLTRIARRMFDVSISLVSLVDENRQWFKSCIGYNENETSRDISFCGHAILGDEIFMIPDTLKDERFSDNPLVINNPKIRFYAGCPLKHMDGSKLGTLCIIDSKPRRLSDDDLLAFKDLAELAENELIAVQLATMDELTKISNRRGFLTLAQKSLDLCARQKIPVSLIYFDLNNFKSINDNFGHEEGDIALIAFANKMIETFRDSDVYARLAGDEFATLLTDASMNFAKDILERFDNAIDAYNKKNDRGYNISFSSGIVCVCNEDSYSIDALLSEADVLMYKQKKEKKKH